MKKGVKSAYQFDSEKVKQKLQEKHKQRHLALVKAHIEEARRGKTQNGIPQPKTAGEDTLAQQGITVPLICGVSCSSAHAFGEIVSNSNLSVVATSSCEAFQAPAGAHGSVVPFVSDSPLPLSSTCCENGAEFPIYQGNPLGVLPSRPFSTEEWGDFLKEVGCDVKTPEILAYLIELEEEIRNDMFFELYDSSHREDFDNSVNEYYSYLAS